jgi:hypothetical protein
MFVLAASFDLAQGMLSVFSSEVQNVLAVQSFDTRFALLRMNGIKYPFPRVSPQGCIEGRSVQVPLLAPPQGWGRKAGKGKSPLAAPS